MSQRTEILQYMKEHKTITRLDAARLGIMELSSRIGELERIDGISISGEWINVINRHGDKVRVKQYWITGGKS